MSLCVLMLDAAESAAVFAERPAALRASAEPDEIPGGFLATFQDPTGNTIYVMDQSTEEADRFTRKKMMQSDGSRGRNTEIFTFDDGNQIRGVEASARAARRSRAGVPGSASRSARPESRPPG